jgi:hypothetical protein
MTDQLGLFPSPPSQASDFRPIHYLGSKVRMLDLIEETIHELAPSGTACDLFSGTGVVAARLARHRRAVAVDVQEYARVLAAALLDPQVVDARALAARGAELARAIPVEALSAFERACLTSGQPDALCEILEDGSMQAGHLDAPASSRLSELLAVARAATPPGADTVLTRYYGGVYFSYEQAAALDGLAAAARALPSPERETALAAVLGTASDAVTSVGNHFAQPVRPRGRDLTPKRATLAAVIRRRALDVPSIFRQRLERLCGLPAPATPGAALRADYRDALHRIEDLAVVYADPPYTRDHYSRFYHVLETIALGDEPEISTVTIKGRTRASRGLYRVERHQSPFCIKSEAPGAFRALFEQVAERGVPLLLSYSPFEDGGRPRLMTVDDIEALAATYFGEVERRSAGGHLAHSKLNAERLNSGIPDEAEILLLCRP